MKVLIQDLFNSITIDIPEDESEFYHELARQLVNRPVPNTITVSCDMGQAIYESNYRSGTLCIFNNQNTIQFPQTVSYPIKYLTCVDPVKNSYKFYKLEQINDIVAATYGRIGSKKGELFGERTYRYNRDMYWIKYEEKIHKGYQDKTALYLERDIGACVQDKKPEGTEASRFLYNDLKTYAKNYIEQTCVSGYISAGMAKQARKILTGLFQTTTLTEFNQKLLELIVLVPRKVIDVQRLLAQRKQDYSFILDREESLVSAMEALVSGQGKSDHCFESIGIRVDRADSSKSTEILAHLAPQLRSKVDEVFVIENDQHTSRFQKYCMDKKITETKYLWHGSRNENWFSIVENGLLLNPNAKITGKMFGNGIYFAPKSTKSWNYTSFKGSLYGGGISDVGYMGLYQVAYGNPLHVDTSHAYTEQILKKNNCVHAHAGCHLLNDEIVFFNEAAMVLKYLVRFH